MSEWRAPPLFWVAATLLLSLLSVEIVRGWF